MKTQLFKNFARKLLPLVFVFLLSSAKEAGAEVCWSIFGGGPLGPPCLFACWCDDYDQPVTQMSVAASPNNQDTEKKTDTCPESGTTDPVDFSNGQFTYNCRNLEAPGRSLDLETTHTYNSGSLFNGPFGYGWMMNFYVRLHVLRSADAIIVQPNGRKILYDYNGSVFLPPAGRFETLVKNPDFSWTLTFPHGEEYQFDPEGKLLAIEDRNNNAITFAYSATPQTHFGRSPYAQDPLASIIIGVDKRLTQLTDTTGRVVQFNYNAQGLLSTIVDGTRTFTFNYDTATNDLLSVTKPATAQFPNGVAKSFLYNSDHNLTHITDEKGQTFVQNIYDTEGRVEEQILGGTSILLNYSVPNQTTETDRNGNQTAYTFNTNGLVTIKETLTRGLRPSDPASFTTNFAYNSNFLKTAETFPKGNGIVYVYDDTNANARARGNILEVRRKADMTLADNDINDIVTRFTYEPNFNLIKTLTDSKSNVTAFTYDYELNPLDPRYGTNGNLVTVTYPTAGAQTPVVELDYNEYGQIVEAVDPNGNSTQFEYFPITGYLKKVIQDPAGINAQTQFTYDAFGYLDTITDANNHVSNLDYNELGWLTKTTDALGQETLLSYDANGNLAKSERKSNYRYPYPAKTYTYTVTNKIQTAADEVGNTTTFGYDSNENLASVADANGKITTSQYDERNLLWKVTPATMQGGSATLFGGDANSPSGVTEYAYDLNGNPSQIKDANGNATNYLYDLFDREERMTYADGSFSQYAYDKNSNLTQHLTPSTKAIDYVYDELNRLTDKTSPQDSSINTTYGYDAGSRLTSVARLLSPVTYQYDALNRVIFSTSTLNALPYTLAYVYDKAGNRTKLTYPDGTAYNFTYDTIDRPDLIKDATLVTLVDYNYNPENRMRGQRKYGGKLAANYGYDYAQRLTSVVNSYYSHTVYPPKFPVENISLLEKWLILTERLAGVREAFATDKPTKPYDVWKTRSKSVYSLDSVGNRLTNTTTAGIHNYVYNNIYELTGVTGLQTHNYAYDKVGNRTTVDGTTYIPNALNQYDQVASQIYSYDSNGNLTDDGPNGYTYDVENRLISAQNVSHNSSYEYDGLGRRISKTVDGSTTYFVYDGDQIIEERASNGTLLASYLYGEGIDEILLMKRNSTNYWYLHDGLGSVTDVVDLTGKIVYERYEYDPYGKPTIYNASGQQLASSAIGNSFMFTGREFDEETGNYHYRRRTYLKDIGRFGQRDPLGYYDSMNLFSYVGNSPVNFIDPYGLLTIPFTNIWIPAGEMAGQQALNYWANRYAGASTLYEKFAYGAAGTFSALWTPCTSDKTAGIVAGSIGTPQLAYQAFRRGGWLNNNPFIRIGWGWKGSRQSGYELFRIAWGREGSEFHGHFDFWNLFRR